MERAFSPRFHSFARTQPFRLGCDGAGLWPLGVAWGCLLSWGFTPGCDGAGLWPSPRWVLVAFGISLELGLEERFWWLWGGWGIQLG